MFPLYPGSADIPFIAIPHYVHMHSPTDKSPPPTPLVFCLSWSSRSLFSLVHTPSSSPNIPCKQFSITHHRFPMTSTASSNLTPPIDSRFVQLETCRYYDCAIALAFIPSPYATLDPFPVDLPRSTRLGPIALPPSYAARGRYNFGLIGPALLRTTRL